MQNNNFLSRDKTQALIDGIGVKQTDGEAFLKGLADQGYIIEGYNEPKQEPTAMQQVRNIAGEVVKPVERMGLTIAKGIQSGIQKVSEATGIAGSLKDTQLADINKFNDTRTLGTDATGIAGNTVDQLGYRNGQALHGTELAKDVAGNVMQNAAMVLPGGATSLAGKVALAGASGATYGAGEAMQEQGSTAGDIAKRAAMYGVGGAVLPVIPIAGKLAKAGAKQIIPAVQKTAEVTGNLAKGIGSLAKSGADLILDTPTRIATNVAETNATRNEIKALPTAQARRAVTEGIHIADTQDILNITKANDPYISKLVKGVQDFANRKSKVDPISIVGEPIFLLISPSFLPITSALAVFAFSVATIGSPTIDMGSTLDFLLAKSCTPFTSLDI